MNYKKTYTPKNGYTPLCEIGKCSLKDLEFGILELSDGQSYTYETKDREVAFIILGGKANFTANGKDYGMVGARRNVFENPKAECFYAPRNCSVKIDSPWNIKIAVCSTPIDVDSEPQAIHQADVRVVRLGVKPWERDTSFIVDDEAEMIATMGDGLYAASMGGGSVNPATGEFNFAVNEGYLIKDGKIAHPVRGASLVGKGGDILLQIDRVGKNMVMAQGMCGSMSGSVPVNVGQPWIRVKSITVGGRQQG